jgi:lysophospholipase L1-like esterase
VLVTLLAVGLLPVAGTAGASTSAATADVRYLVSLGDSLAVGVQPLGQPPQVDVETDEGYADQLDALLQASVPGLRLVKLGCGGETTRSMRFGSVDPSEGFSCGPPAFYRHRYPHKTQLAEAVAFLHAHRRNVSLVTIDIGGNDMIGGGGIARIQANLPVILADLRDAAGPDVPIVGMTYHDPLLPSVWFGSHDLGAVAAEVQRLVAFDDVLEGDYAAAGDPVADVEGAFASADETLQPDGNPLDVDRVCDWSWICSRGDIHPNAAGYGAIAQAFMAALPPAVRDPRPATSNRGGRQ